MLFVETRDRLSSELSQPRPQGACESAHPERLLLCAPQQRQFDPAREHDDAQVRLLEGSFSFPDCALARDQQLNRVEPAAIRDVPG